MNRRIAIFLVLCLLISLGGCTQRKTAGDAEADAQKEQAENVPESTESTPEPVLAESANPVQISDREGVLAALGVELLPPEGAETVSYLLFDTTPPLAELSFQFEGHDYAYRVAPSAFGEESIHGLYYPWTQEAEVSLGYLTASLHCNQGGAGVIEWLDAAPGLLYALSMPQGATAELLWAMAERLFTPVQGDVGGDEPELSGTPLQVDPAFAGEFTAVLDRIRTEARPGTAGGSLVSANLCASLCDVLTAHQPSWVATAQLLEEYRGGLDEATQTLYGQQLDSVLSAFQEISGSYGQELLETAGCDSQIERWDMSAMGCYMAAMTMAGVDTAPYRDILNVYAAAHREGWDAGRCAEAGLNYMAADCTVGYLVKDLDRDGRTELVIAAMEEDDFLRGLVLELYTLDEQGTAAPVLRSAERDRWYNVSMPLLYHEGSSGADNSFAETVLYGEGQLTVLGGTEERTINSLTLLPVWE